MELAGDSRPLAEIADTFGRVTGRPVRYVQIPWSRVLDEAGGGRPHVGGRMRQDRDQGWCGAGTSVHGKETG